MSHTNSTANLSLPQFIGTDKPTWLSDVNGAFAAIDSYAGSNDAALAIVDGKADTAIGDASSAVTTATNAATTAGNAAATATNANTIAGNALTVANGINSKVGVLTDLTTTDKSTVVNAINEVNGKDAGDIAYDNTGSGLTATNVQDAIDEVAQGGGGGFSITTAWTNPNPTAVFAAQSVTVDLSAYHAIIIAYTASVDNPNLNGYLITSLLTAESDQFEAVYLASNNSYSRQASWDATGVTFADGYESGTLKNERLVPYKIYGI